MTSQATRLPLAGMPAAWLRDNCPCAQCQSAILREGPLLLSEVPANPGTVLGCCADPDGAESAVAVGEHATTGVTRRKDRT